jgi:magnesium transporter
MPLARAGGEIELEQVGLVIGPRWVISFQEGREDCFDPVRERIRANATIRRMQADYLAYALVDLVIDAYYPAVESLGDVLEALEEEVVGEPTRTTLATIHHVRRQLLVIHRLLWQQRDALGRLLRGESPRIGADVRVYLRDAYDHVIQLIDVVESYREMAVSLMEVYLSSVSNRLNEVMKVLTVMSTIFIPLTFLVGVYGMNFQYMPELHQRWAYPALWVAMLAIAAVMIWAFRRRGWIGHRARLRPEPSETPEVRP